MPDQRLALDGGSPLFPQGPPSWPFPSPAVQEALESVYRDGSWGKYHGGRVQRLADRLAEQFQAAHCLPCCSGTFAVELALRGLQITSGHEVILAAYDFPGNFRSIEAVGARPVLVDVKEGSWSVDLAEVKRAAGPQTRAIIASHMHGSLVPMPELCEWARAEQIAVVEDACQTPGAAIDGRPAGSWGDVGVLSFGGSKLLTAGRGGAVLTSSPDIEQRMRIFNERGNETFPLSELQAAVLLAQLDSLDEQNQRREAAVRELRTALHGSRLLQFETLQTQSAHYKVPWSLDTQQVSRSVWIEAAKAEGIAMDAGFRGFAKRTARRCRIVGDLSNARRIAETTLLLHHPILLRPADELRKLIRGITMLSEALPNR